MSDFNPITPGHRQRIAYVYVRQSTAHQLELNRESTRRQYDLVDRAVQLGWPRERVSVIDDDLGVSGAGLAERPGFARLTADVALGRVGLVLGLDASRLARNNADWYRLLDLCGATDTLIGDGERVYHPGMFDDRLVLGLKGTMSEAELFGLRARLTGGIRSKAARGELRRGLPIGFVWGDADGEVRFHPDEAVVRAIRLVFDKFAELGSARRVWLWFRANDLMFPQATSGKLAVPSAIRWVVPTYIKIHSVLTNPVYAGVYTYGRTRREPFIDEQGHLRKRLRRLPRAEWSIAIRDHHPGYIDWATFEHNQARLAANARPRPHESGTAVREGAALLQGIAVCGHCGRGLHVYYSGRQHSPGYYCSGDVIINGRADHCFRVGGCAIDRAVAEAFLQALAPAALEASLRAIDHLHADLDAAIQQARDRLERARYDALRADRRYHAVDPENRLVARGLEAEWEKCLHEVEAAEADLAAREQSRPTGLSHAERRELAALGRDVSRVWSSPAITDRDRKELLRLLLDEVLIRVDRSVHRAYLTLRWKGGTFSDLEVSLARQRPRHLRTDESTLDLIRRLTPFYPDGMIAGILNRQGRRTLKGLRFTANRVWGIRNYWKIVRAEKHFADEAGEWLNVSQLARRVGTTSGTILRWVTFGIIPAEQLTPGAPWRIHLTAELRARFVEAVPPGHVTMLKATHLLGIPRDEVLQRIKAGELEAVHVITDKKGLRIKIPPTKPRIKSTANRRRGAV